MAVSAAKEPSIRSVQRIIECYTPHRQSPRATIAHGCTMSGATKNAFTLDLRDTQNLTAADIALALEDWGCVALLDRRFDVNMPVLCAVTNL